MNPDDWKDVISKGIAHRGWIANSYAQIEYLMGDFIVRCRAFPEYNLHTGTVSHSATKRVSKVRSILEMDGPVSNYAEVLDPVLTGFEQNQDLRNLLAHGFCTFLHTASGDAGFYFRKFDRAPLESDADHIITEKTLRLVDLEYHRAQLVHQAQTALTIFQTIHAQLGWGELA